MRMGWNISETFPKSIKEMFHKCLVPSVCPWSDFVKLGILLRRVNIKKGNLTLVLIITFCYHRFSISSQWKSWQLSVKSESYEQNSQQDLKSEPVLLKSIMSTNVNQCMWPPDLMHPLKITMFTGGHGIWLGRIPSKSRQRFCIVPGGQYRKV